MRIMIAKSRAAVVLPRFPIVKPRLTRGLWRRLSWQVPSWVLSLVLHTAILVTVGIYLPYWHRAPVGFGGTADQLGVIDGTLSSKTFGFDTSSGAPGPANDDTAPASESDAPPPEVETTAVAPLTAPMSLPSRITTSDFGSVPTAVGIGAAFPASIAANPRELISGGGGLGGGGSGRGSGSGHGDGGIGGTSFMGVKDKATRVVFVIDSSASMADNHAMASAKAALISALQTLVDSQQFQVVFYNSTPSLLRMRNEREVSLAFATEVNKTLARQEIAAVIPDRGTNHLDALKLALRLGPEVIYLLTDADEPQLSAAQLDDVHRLNRGKTRIHAIEFGLGEPLEQAPMNFLQKLAAQSGGTYRYYDVKRLGRQ
jgi:hypothetical protein